MKKNSFTYLFLLFTVFSSAQTVFTVNGISYKTTSATSVAIINNNIKYIGNLVIPEIVNYNNIDYNVTSISNLAFKSCYDLLSINLPYSITSIGDSSFLFSGLTSIYIPNTVKYIGKSAFSHTNLKTITIPDSVKAIEDKTFEYCYDLISVTIPDSVKSIGKDAFFSCNKLNNFKFPIYLKSIGEQAFYKCSSLSSIDIPNTVTSLGAGAFNATQWYENQKGDVVYAGKCLYHYKPILMPAGTQISILAGTTCIAEGVFNSRQELVAVSMPNTIVNIGKGAFLNCSGLTSINLSESLTSINEHTFYGCSKLTTIVMPSSVTTIKDNAFYNCTKLLLVTFPSSLHSIKYKAFYGTAWYNNQPDGLVYANKVIYGYKGAMPVNTKINIPNGMKGLASQAFSGCSNLVAVTIPNSIISIESSAFYGCKLTTVTIPSSVTSFGSYAFYDCTELTSFYTNSSTPLDLSLESSVFTNINKTSCILYVPKGSKALYKVANQWKDFLVIAEFDGTALPSLFDARITLYPNPFVDSFRFTGIEGSAILHITDLNGRDVLNKQVTGNELVSVGLLPKGLYILKLITNEKTLEQKVIKK